MNAVTDTLKPGVVVQDTYRIDALLGEGGMGATFAGHNLATDHPVAIKVISAAFASNSRAVELFRREANLLRTIQHEAVVRYETTLLDRDGRLYLVMEKLDGHPLSRYVQRGARLSPQDTLRLGRRLAAGLDAIAAVGTVHRDIAPDNIFVPDDDIQKAKLIDFGLASNTIGTEKSILGDDFAGKFSYCAPEQLGVIDAPVSPRTDAYALGLVLMKVAGLPVPGEGKGVGAGAARRADLQIPKDAAGPALHGVLTQLLRADPAARPSPITPVFEAALAPAGPRPGRSDATQAAVAGAAKRARGRRPVLLAGGAAALAAVGALAFLFLGPGSAPVGTALDQGRIGEAALAADDPLAEVRALVSAGDDDSLNGALAALLAMGRNEAQPDPVRIEALTMAARMSDPQTFDPGTSPFAEPDGGMARRLYLGAAELGSEDARRAAARLEE